MAVDTTVSNQVYLSRDQIRTQIIEYIQYYMELENVDLTKSSFLSFVINILSTLTSNLLFYESSVYREFFLTKAQLPESVLNLSAFLGYNTKEASFSVAEVLMTIPLGFEDSDTTFYIPEKFKFKAGSIEFLTYYSTEINVINNTSVTITVTEGSKTYNLAVDIDLTVPEFSFVMPIRQYKIIEQEFQIDSDLQLYQFTTLDVPLSGKVSAMTVQIREPGQPEETGTYYTEFASLYLMSSTDYGYVSRRTASGRTLYFGNGLIGAQPIPASAVKVVVYETEGEDGNVIATSINTGERIYTTTEAGMTKIVNYTCTNVSPAAGGEDEESIEDIRSNSIKNLVSLGRLVSEVDYKNVDVVIPYSPFKTAPYPVLKRSDVNCNEIQLYSNLLFGDGLVPTRNETLDITSDTVTVPRGTIINSGGDDFSTLFDMTVDHINGAAYYDYIMYEIVVTPTLQTTYDPTYNSIVLQSLTVSLNAGSADFTLTYTGADPVAVCLLQILKTGQNLEMNHDIPNKKFTYSFTPYTLFPQGDILLNFTVSSALSQKYTYAVIVTFRKSLNDFMMSNVMAVDSTSSIVYDIPVVQKSYYDGIVKRDFEVQVLQYLMSSLTFADYKMITDFVNVKFTNTIGRMVNMQKNPTTKQSVLSLSQTSVPVGLLGDRYIVNGTEGGDWEDQKNKIAQCIDQGAQTWYFFTPTMNDIVYVTDEDVKYIFTGSQWFLPEYDIPLKLEIEVFKSDTYLGTSNALTSLIKENIITAFEDRFGSNISLYQSEIIKVVQETEGVGHCNLVKPESNIFFDFNIDEFTQLELLSYTPEYVYFTESDITVKILG
jgi:hypothetical protein